MDLEALSVQNSDKILSMKLGNLGKSCGFPFFVIFILSVTPVLGQNADIGIGLGGLSYTGDLQRNYKILENRLAGNIFYRYTFSNAVSVRGAITGGKLQGSDDKPYDDFASLRNTRFDIFLLEGAVTVEYHFLNFLDSKTWINHSPYFFAGVGAFTFFGDLEKGRKIQPVIPVGVGLKYLLDERWQLGLEFGARKTFFDYLDDVSEFDASLSKRSQGYQYGNQFDQDWYYFLGLSVSYTFYQIPCPYAP